LVGNPCALAIAVLYWLTLPAERLNWTKPPGCDGTTIERDAAEKPSFALQAMEGWKTEKMVRRNAHLAVWYLAVYADNLKIHGTILP
jgi:hypothetical protein